MSEKTQTVEFVPAYDKNGIRIYQANCGEILPTIKDVDLIISDPPWQLHGYSMEIQDKGKIGDEGEARWFKYLWQWYASWLSLVVNTGVEKGWFYLGWYQVTPFLRLLTLMNWPIQHIIPKHDKEFLIYVGPDRIQDDHIESIEEHFRVGKYNNRKPVEFIRRLIRASATEHNSLILDPFAGEGSTLVASALEGHPAVGIEITEEYCQSAIKKLDKVAL